jgi:4a-hydroxytetrahydrobiopterin dehydratase
VNRNYIPVTHFHVIRFGRDHGKLIWQLAVMAKLKASQIKAALRKVPEWKKCGATIVRTFQFKDFVAAMKFVNGVARLAEKAWHHPEIDIRWNKVTLTLSTHSEGGLTEKDFKLARQFDRL